LRINEKDNDRISKYKLWNHHPFCSDYCIELYKEYGRTTKALIADWEENGVYGYWKKKSEGYVKRELKTKILYLVEINTKWSKN
jgi:hypothetical protein